MTTLTGSIIQNTYKQLLQVGSGNVGLTSALKTVQDGNGTDSVLQLSTTAVNVNAPSISVNGNDLTVGSSGITVGGHEIVLGSGTISVDGTPIGGGGTTGKPIVQQVYTITGAVATGTTVIPYDDTIPQITEGDEYMSLAITPTDANNLLVISVQANVYNTGTGVMQTMALFQDATADALSASIGRFVANSGNSFALQHIMVAGTTSSTTFRVRIGASGTSTTTFNGVAGTRIYGGVANSYIHIQEITV